MNDPSGPRAPNPDRRITVSDMPSRLNEALREMDRILEEMITAQRAKVLRIGRDYAPGATPEDLMNPHDIPALLAAPQFHFEDGILSGYISAQMALRAGVLRPWADEEPTG